MARAEAIAWFAVRCVIALAVGTALGWFIHQQSWPGWVKTVLDALVLGAAITFMGDVRREPKPGEHPHNMRE
jgi:hypothetical protein